MNNMTTIERIRGVLEMYSSPIGTNFNIGKAIPGEERRTNRITPPSAEGTGLAGQEKTPKKNHLRDNPIILLNGVEIEIEEQ